MLVFEGVPGRHLAEAATYEGELRANTISVPCHRRSPTRSQFLWFEKADLLDPGRD
jgi:hypothetical protein